MDFNGIFSKPIDMVDSSLHINIWEHKVGFHVVEGKIQPILGFTWPKTHGFTVNCAKERLDSHEGGNVLCHEVQLNTNKVSLVKTRKVKFILTRNVKGHKIIRK